MRDLLKEESLYHESAVMAGVRTLLLGNDIDVEEIQEFQHGVAARNFFARGSDGRTFVVRFDRRRTLDMARDDRIFSELARSNGLEVPFGPWMECRTDGATIVARPYLEGKSLPDIPTGSWPSGSHFGELLGTLHAMRPPSSQRPFFYQSAFNLAPKLRSRFSTALCHLADTAEDAALFREATRRLRAMPEYHLLLESSPKTVIHGDYTPGNFLVSASGLYLIDWEKACVGPAYSDVSQALYYFCAALSGKAQSFFADFISAYARQSSIEVESLRAWLSLHPTVIFLHDAAAVLANRNCGHLGFDRKREIYFREQSLRRYRSFLDMEAMVLSSILADR